MTNDTGKSEVSFNGLPQRVYLASPFPIIYLNVIFKETRCQESHGLFTTYRVCWQQCMIIYNYIFHQSDYAETQRFD